MQDTIPDGKLGARKIVLSQTNWPLVLGHSNRNTRGHAFYADKLVNSPVLSPKEGTGTSMRLSMATKRLVSGVSFLYLRCRPVLMEPPPLPARRIGNSS